VQAVVAGTSIAVDATDPSNPVVSVVAGAVLSGDPPMVNRASGSSAIVLVVNALLDALEARGVITTCD